MGFFDWLFGGSKESKKEPAPVPKEYVHIDDVIKEMESKGTNVTGETGGFGNYILVKPIDLDSDVDVDAGKNDLLKGNLVIFDTQKIMNNRELCNTLLVSVSDAVREVHGEIRRLADNIYLAVPPGYKFVSRPIKTEE